MRKYLVEKFILHSTLFFIGLVILPLLFYGQPDYVIPRGVFIGGIFGGIYTYYDFKQRNIWPLFDNFRYPKYLLLLGLFLMFQTLSLILYPLF